jgi:hypothetical protein
MADKTDQDGQSNSEEEVIREDDDNSDDDNEDSDDEEDQDDNEEEDEDTDYSSQIVAKILIENPDEYKIDDEYVRRMYEVQQQKNKPRYETIPVPEPTEAKEVQADIKEEKDGGDNEAEAQAIEPAELEKGQAKYIHKALKKAYRKKDNTKTHKNKPKEKISYE